MPALDECPRCGASVENWVSEYGMTCCLSCWHTWNQENRIQCDENEKKSREYLGHHAPWMLGATKQPKKKRRKGGKS